MEKKTEKVQEDILVEDDDDIRHVNLRTLITERYKITVYTHQSYGELLDLQKDPQERENLWECYEYKEIKYHMLERLMQKMLEQQDRTTRRIGIA